MKWINNISDAAKQNFTLIGEAGEVITFNLYFLTRQNSWFFDIACEAQGLSCAGMRLCLSPNLLRNFKNNISFGLAVVSTDGFDPSGIEDFVSGRVQIYTLNAADVQTVETDLFPLLPT